MSTALMFGVASANANTYQWNGSVSSTWGTAANWSTGTGITAGPAPTNGSYNHRLNVTNAPNFECIYDASLGTTVYGSNTVRALVVGSLFPGNFRITGGTFSGAGQTNASNNPDIVGNGNNLTTSSFTVDGGNYISAASGLTIGNSSGFVNASLNLSNGTATITTLMIDAQTSTVNLNGGTLTVRSIITNSPNVYTRVFNFNGGTLKPMTNSSSLMFNLTRANVRDGGAVIDTSGFNVTIPQPLIHSVIGGDNATDGGLTKKGAGTLTLTGANTYTGPTAVNQGTLVMDPISSSSGLILASGATFQISSNSGNWAMSSAALTNSTIQFNYGAFDGNTSAVLSPTSISLSGNVTINVSGTGFPVTDITLLTYGSKTGSGSFVLGTIPAGAVANLQDTGSAVILHITSPSSQNLVWSASVNNIWKTNGAANWNGGAATYLEYFGGTGDNVTFDDTFAGGTVDIQSTVKPSSIAVSDISSFYTFSGVGKISGATGISKSGTSTLDIYTTNDFDGAVSVTGGGTLTAHTAAALGSTNGATTVSGNSTVALVGGVTVASESISISGNGVGGTFGALRGADASNNVWAGPVTVTANNARIGVESGGQLTVSGNITDNGNNYTVIFRNNTAGSITISGSGNTWGGTSSLLGTDATGVTRIGVANALPTNSVIGVGNCTFDLNGFNQTCAGLIKAFTSATDSSSIVINNGASPVTLTLSPSLACTNSGVIQDGVSSISLVKSGAGAQTLSGTTSYTGPTAVNAGQLNLTDTSPLTTSITVAGGATLGGEATTTGSLTLNANSALSIDPATPGAFTAGSVSASASPISVSFTSLPATNADVLVLVATGGITGSAANFQASSIRGGVFYLTNSNTELHYVATGVPASLVWKGNNISNPSFWDVGTTTNWSNGGSPDKFFSSDSVIFDDTASSFTVSVRGTSVSPGGLNFTNISSAYTVSGGAIAGAIELVKSGAGVVTLAGTNTYSGGTTVTNGGNLIAGNASSLGSGPAVVAANSTLQLNTPGSTTFATTLLGDGRVRLFMSTPGLVTTLLPNMGGFGGVIELTNFPTTGDALNVGGITAPAARVQVDAGCMLYISSSATLSNVLVTGAGNLGAFGALRIGNSSGVGPATLTSDVTLTGDSTFGFSSAGSSIAGVISGSATTGNTQTLTVGTSAAGSGGSFDGAITDGSAGGKLGLIQSHATLILSAANTYSGPTTISGSSTLSLGTTGSISNSAAINLNNGNFNVLGLGSFTLEAAQSMGGVGTVNGDVVANGTLTPGNPLGTLNFNNNLTVAGNLLFRVNKALTPSNSVINVVGTLTNTGTGTVTITNVGAIALTNNDTFKLFSQPLAGGGTLNIVGPAGVTFTNNLAVDGTISVLTVAPAVATNPTNITFTVAGGSLNLSWPADHLGWVLQTQTNSRSLGLSSNWTDIAGSDSVTATNFSVSPASPTVFYRLRLP